MDPSVQRKPWTAQRTGAGHEEEHALRETQDRVWTL